MKVITSYLWLVATLGLFNVAAVASDADLRQAEQQIFQLANQAREDAGVEPLQWNEQAAQAARAHAKMMAEKQALSHQFSGEPAMRERMAATGLRFDSVAENVADAESADGVHQVLMNSPPHRQNLLNPKYNSLGIGVAKNGDQLFVVQDFAHSISTRTSEEVEAAAAQLPNGTNLREIHEARQGYGFAIQRGLREATGDYIVISEPDGTFLGRDTFKLLAYVEDFDVVYGSRTARTFIWRGANMGAWLRWGNWGVAKLMEFLFNSTNLTDVGCTMRLVRRDALAQLENEFTIGGSALDGRLLAHADTKSLMAWFSSSEAR